jgi:hypothetical protein
VSVTVRIGDIGRRFNLYWNIPFYNTTASYTGWWSTTSSSFVLATSGSVNIANFVNTLSNFYDTVIISYSFQQRITGTSYPVYAYMKILGVAGTTFSTSSIQPVTNSETVEHNTPTNGIITWELWHRTSNPSYTTSYVGNPSFTIYLLNKNKTSVTADELNIGQLFVTGYKLDPQTMFVFDDNQFYTFYNPSSTSVLLDTFDTPVAVNKISIIKPTATSTAELYLIAV